MPGQSFQSKLEPHFDFILEARRHHQTWEAIAQVLSVQGTATTKQAVHAFVKRRLKRRYPLGLAPAEVRPLTSTVLRVEEPAADLPNAPPPESEQLLRALTNPLPVKGPLWKQT
jgi:hypothetical protein